MLVPKYELLIGKQQFDSSGNINRDFTGATSPSYWLASPYADAGSISVDWGGAVCMMAASAPPTCATLEVPPTATPVACVP